MTARIAIHVFAACALFAAGSLPFVAPAQAYCDGNCEASPPSEPAAAAAPAAKPLPLKKFLRKPVATAAVRVVKTSAGSYARTGKSGGQARVKLARRGKQPWAAPQFMPVAVSSQAGQSLAAATATTDGLASREPTGRAKSNPKSSAMDADGPSQVAVVSADRVNEIDLAADAPRPATTMADNAVPAKADVVASTAPAQFVGNAATTNLVIAKTADPAPDDSSWAQRMLMIFGGAFAAAAAAGRMLMAA